MKKFLLINSATW